MFPIALIWRVFAAFWVCNYGVTFCYYFYYCYDIVLILRTPFYFILLHTHENTFTIFCPVTSSLEGKKKKGKGNIKAFNKIKEGTTT